MFLIQTEKILSGTKNVPSFSQLFLCNHRSAWQTAADLVSNMSIKATNKTNWRDCFVIIRCLPHDDVNWLSDDAITNSNPGFSAVLRKGNRYTFRGNAFAIYILASLLNRRQIFKKRICILSSIDPFLGRVTLPSKANRYPQKMSHTVKWQRTMVAVYPYALNIWKFLQVYIGINQALTSLTHFTHMVNVSLPNLA